MHNHLKKKKKKKVSAKPAIHGRVKGMEGQRGPGIHWKSEGKYWAAVLRMQVSTDDPGTNYPQSRGGSAQRCISFREDVAGEILPSSCPTFGLAILPWGSGA